MRVLSTSDSKSPFRFFSSKRGVSLMVSYVLLVAIAISLSIIVFTWLRFIASTEEAPQCPEGIHLIIDSYNCSANPHGVLNVTLKNKGRFTVDEFVLRVNDRVDAEFGIYQLSPTTTSSLKPGEKNLFMYHLNQSAKPENPIRLIDAQPIVTLDGKKRFCKSFSTQKATCP